MGGERSAIEKERRQATGGTYYLGVPPITGPDDWNFGDHPPADTDTRWAISTHVTVDPTVLERGDIWSAANSIRYRLYNGRLLIQTTGDSSELMVMTYPLTGGARANDVVALTFTMDSSSYVYDVDSYTMIYSQSTLGEPNYQNAVFVTVGQSSYASWIVVVGLVEGGIGYSLYSTTIYEYNCPVDAIIIGINATVLSVWVGNKLTECKRLVGQISTTIAPDRVSMFMKNWGFPNRMWGLQTFRRQTTVTF